jgi:hypothetical protein
MEIRVRTALASVTAPIALTTLLVGAMAAIATTVAVTAQGASAAAAPNVTEWSSEARTVVAFKVNAQALQARLPAGWVPAPSTHPATAGANINVTFMERQIVLDPQGKPLKTGTSRYAVLGVAARNVQTGQANTIVIGGLSPEGAGAYGVYTTATTATLERRTTGSADQQARVDEAWEIASAAGDDLVLHYVYRRGPVTRAHVETVVRSALHPEFQRTYRIDQAADLVRSATAPDRVEQFAFRASGPLFAALFDGTEVLVGVTAIPYYVREISIP